MTTPLQNSVGVAVGKFNPPHMGHVHLVRTAAAQVNHLFVLLADDPDQTIRGDVRAGWLLDAAPANVTILVTPDDIPAANEPWAARALEVLPATPDIAFTSETWGPGWAAAMGAGHVAIDVPRAEVPISASRIRADLRGNFHWLVPAARVALARRIVVVGAESTGKTSLAQQLARSFGTVWVPEYGRWYWEGRRHLADQAWDSDEFLRVAATHHQTEVDLARRAAGGLVIADTDALVTAVWHRRYLGFDLPVLQELALRHRPDLYLICEPDFPWVQDGTRESSDHRQAMHRLTVELVAASGVHFDLVGGTRAARHARASRRIEEVAVFDPLT